jgi:hypothetical protein
LVAETAIEVQPPPLTVPLPDEPEPLLEGAGDGDTWGGDETGGGDGSGRVTGAEGAGDAWGAGEELGVGEWGELEPPPDPLAPPPDPTPTLPEPVFPTPTLVTGVDPPIRPVLVEAGDVTSFGGGEVGIGRDAGFAFGFGFAAAFAFGFGFGFGATRPLCAALDWG